MSKYREDEEALMKEFGEALAFIEENEITRTVETPNGDVIIPVEAIRFAQNDSDKDLHGDSFDKSVDLGHPATTTAIPAYLDHGKDKIYIAAELVSYGYTVKEAVVLADAIAVGKQQIGVAVRSKIDPQSLYYNIIVNRRFKYKEMLKRLAEEKRISPSSAASFRENDPENKSLIKMWHLKEITLTPTQAEPRLEVVQKSLEEESQMGKEEDKGMPPAAPAAATPTPQPEGGGEEKPSNPIIEQIEKSFAPPTPAEPAPAVEIGQVMSRLEAIEKSLADLTALAQNNIPQTLIAAQQLQEAMPVLVEHVAKALAPGMAELIASQRSKSQAEIQIEKGLGGARPSAPVRPGNGQWPARTPGGK